MTSWFVETLTLRTWLLDVRPRLEEGKLWYIDGRSHGGAERLSWRMIDVRDKNGLLVRLRMAYDDLTAVQADVVAEPAFQAFVKDAPGRLPAALGKAAANITLAPGSLWRAMYLIQVAAWKAGSGAVIFLEDRPWKAVLERYGLRSGVRVFWTRPVPRPKALAQSLLPVSAVSLAQLARRGELATFFRRPAKLTGARITGEYYGQLNLDKPELASDLFWLQESALKPSDVAVAFTTSVRPLDEPLRADLKRRGLESFATHPGAARGKVPLFVPKGAAPRGSWLERQAAEYRRQRAFWREVFAATGTKVFVSWYKNDPTHCAIADALEDVGGALALYQRSYEALPTVELAAFADVNFAFSHESAAILKKDGSRVRHNIVVGMLGDHRIPLLRPQAAALRARLQAAGAERIIAAYDENSAPDPRWHTGDELQRSNYRLLCEKVLSEPWLGVVFKPKVARTLRHRLGPVAELLKRAEATGRCHVFEEGTMFSSVVPAAAGLAADVVVHGHLCGGTAAIEAALAGKPTLMVDQEGWQISPLYRLGVGKVVFRTWEEAWQAFVDNPPGLGDWTCHLDAFDPFRDGKAARRMGEYLEWLLEGLRSGISREAALDQAAERYAAKWGADKCT